MRKRNVFLIVFGVFVLVAIGLIALVIHGIDFVENSQMGMAFVYLPSGAQVYLHRWEDGSHTDKLYLAKTFDDCAPYDRLHDYKLPPGIVTGDPWRPLLISFDGDTIIVHAPRRPSSPWLPASKPLAVKYEYLPDEAYQSLASKKTLLPSGWQRLKVSFGHNTCLL